MADSLYEKVKQLALDELRSKGYAPNPADVQGIVKGVLDILEEELSKAQAPAPSKSSKPATPPST
jgi:hypothetical protein